VSDPITTRRRMSVVVEILARASGDVIGLGRVRMAGRPLRGDCRNGGTVRAGQEEPGLPEAAGEVPAATPDYVEGSN
jgi:hypothetical protein